jgi:hypothetical protein
MTKVNIWFNRTFGTTYHVIQELRKNSSKYDFRFFGTHTNLQSVFLQACDYVEKEPLLNDTEYIDYSLDFCKRHKIDIFLPGEFSAAIVSAHISLFEAEGIKVGIAFSSENAEILSSKAKIYEALRKVIPEYIPPYHLFYSSTEFLKAQQAFTKGSESGSVPITCFKPDKGIGGLGFRIVDDTINEFRGLMSYPSPRNTFDYYYRIFQMEKSFSPLILMEYLHGPEISIDCLASSGKILFSVAKEKKGSLRVVNNLPKLQDICDIICKELSLNYLFNIQFRYGNDDRLYLLDLNPRPSGGLYYSYKAGYPLMTAAIQLLLNEEAPQFEVYPEKSFIELDGSIDYKLFPDL